MRNLDLLNEWYEKALSFKRSRREAIKEFRKRKTLENSGDMRKELVLDILRQDPNAMEVNKCRETRRCYNYGKTGYLATRYSKPRKERREEIRITEKAIEGFSLGRK